MWTEFTKATILLVDDDEDALTMMSRALVKHGCPKILQCADPLEAVGMYYSERPDLVVLDLQLPMIDGLEVMRRMVANEPEELRSPVLMITGNESEIVKEMALTLGVGDFLNKRAPMSEFVLRVRNLLHMRGLVRQIHRQTEWLEETVRSRTRELNHARKEVLERLALAAEYRDDDTGAHTRRVGHTSSLIAAEMNLSATFVELIGSAALLHDLGKIGIPDRILLKPGKLDTDEYTRMKEHPHIGAKILEGCTEPMLEMAREIALSHHERWDGSGYPCGLTGKSIPVSGRIVAVADVFDALNQERPYKRAFTREESLAEIAQGRGTLFDPWVVDAFFKTVDQRVLSI